MSRQTRVKNDLNVHYSCVIAALPLVPVAFLIAVVNSFNEEFTLRAAPISELLLAFGKRQTLMITTFFFGIEHFYGVPSGILGVLLASFLGWFLGKSMLETKGFLLGAVHTLYSR